MKKKNGFTLVELIAAITILGVLLLIGSQVVIDTMNKNKVKVVYTSMDNVTKQARLTFLEDPDISKSGNEEFRKAMVYNKEDFEIERGGTSRVICINLNLSTSKFKNLKLNYFVKKDTKSMYCGYDYNGNPVWYFKKRKTYADWVREKAAKEKGIEGRVEIFNDKVRDGDYIFYLAGVKYSDCPVTPALSKYQVTDPEEFTGDKLESIKNKRVKQICKTFTSCQEQKKYTNDPSLNCGG